MKKVDFQMKKVYFQKKEGMDSIFTMDTVLCDWTSWPKTIL